jgi:hypothetical protein
MKRWLIRNGRGWVFAWERWDGSGRRRWLRLSANNKGHGWAVWVGPLGIGYVR